MIKDICIMIYLFFFKFEFQNLIIKKILFDIYFYKYFCLLKNDIQEYIGRIINICIKF